MKQNAVDKRRRYRIHQRIKRVVKYDARGRSVFTTPEELDGLSGRMTAYVDELRDRFGYNIQTEIR